MARQLPDLPRITGEDLNNEDVLLVRDISAKKDKRVLLEDIVGFVLKDGSIVTSKLADDAVTEAKIKNNAVTKNKIKNGAVDRNKLDWNAFDFQYAATAQSVFTSASSAWAAKDVTNHSFTFSAIVGAKYRISYHSSYINNNSGSDTELDCYFTVVSGLSELTGNGRLTMTGTHGTARSIEAYYQATATTCKIKVQAVCGMANQTLRFDGGYFIAERVA